MDFKKLADVILEENRQVLDRIDVKEINRLIEEIDKAKTIQLYAMGRMGLSMRGFTMRLKHMGYDAYVVYDTTTPCIGEGDLLLVLCGMTNVEMNIVKLSKEAKATIGILSPHPENEIGQLADFTVRVPGQFFGDPSEVKSIQPMCTILEQSMFLLTDIVTMMIIEKNHIDIDKMHKRHTNLEGLLKPFTK
ncbi:sugar isomerase [Sphaerochaeta sp. PS]|uniref:sugar isomerase n=1 Tax=Sphaerochaeta sp. PS TaxID=3076336 RepID=UPI0028A56719|nr:sugar isomerase [Sphaerochaeta sp. PS]MDT4762306.1 sugar isomerase [Sphaerochaeta sp. PS]